MCSNLFCWNGEILIFKFDLAMCSKWWRNQPLWYILGSKSLDLDFSNLGICIMLGLWTLIRLKLGSLLMDTCWTQPCHTPPGWWILALKSICFFPQSFGFPINSIHSSLLRISTRWYSTISKVHLIITRPWWLYWKLCPVLWDTLKLNCFSCVIFSSHAMKVLKNGSIIVSHVNVSIFFKLGEFIRILFTPRKST